MKMLFLLILFLLFGQAGRPQNFLPAGAVSDGLGGTSAAAHSSFAVFGNPAGADFGGKTAVFSSFRRRMELNDLRAGLALPLRNKLILGMGISRFGDEIFSETGFSFAPALQFGEASFGLKINFLQHNFYENGTSRALVFDFGSRAKLMPGLYLGAYFSNIGQAAAGFGNDPYPSVLRAGLAWEGSTNLEAVLEAEKQAELPARLRSGLAYRPHPALNLRAGFATAPFTNTFGFGLKMSRLQMDYATEIHPLLPMTHSFSLIWEWEAKRENTPGK